MALSVRRLLLIAAVAAAGSGICFLTAVQLDRNSAREQQHLQQQPQQATANQLRSEQAAGGPQARLHPLAHLSREKNGGESMQIPVQSEHSALQPQLQPKTAFPKLHPDPVPPAVAAAAETLLSHYALQHAALLASASIPDAVSLRRQDSEAWKARSVGGSGLALDGFLVVPSVAGDRSLAEAMMQVITGVLVGIATDRAVVLAPDFAASLGPLFHFPMSLAAPLPAWVAPITSSLGPVPHVCDDLRQRWHSFDVVDMPEAHANMLPLSLFRSPFARERLLASFDRWPVHLIGDWLFGRVADASVSSALISERERLFPPFDTRQRGTEVVIAAEISSMRELRSGWENAAWCLSRELREHSLNGRRLTIFVYSPLDRTFLDKIDSFFSVAGANSTTNQLMKHVAIVHSSAALDELSPWQYELVQLELMKQADDLLVRRWSYFGHLVQTSTLQAALHHHSAPETGGDRAAPVCQRTVDSTQGLYTEEWPRGFWPTYGWTELRCKDTVTATQNLTCCSDTADWFQSIFLPL